MSSDTGISIQSESNNEVARSKDMVSQTSQDLITQVIFFRNLYFMLFLVNDFCLFWFQILYYSGSKLLDILIDLRKNLGVLLYLSSDLIRVVLHLLDHVVGIVHELGPFDGVSINGEHCHRCQTGSDYCAYSHEYDQRLVSAPKIL